MNTENRYKLMVLAVVALALVNIATIATVIYHRHKSGGEEVVAEDGRPQSEISSFGYSGRYFRDQLNFSNEQTARFVEFNPVFREYVMNLNEYLNLLRQQMLSEMAAEDCDTTKLNVLADSIGTLHATLKRVTYQYYLDIKKICDRQQQKKLELLFSGMFARDGRMGQYGKGGQQGRGRGRQFID